MKNKLFDATEAKVGVRKKIELLPSKFSIQIVQAMANGKTRKEIAAHEKLSVRTIELYIDKMRFTFDAATTQHLVAIFFREKLIK